MRLNKKSGEHKVHPYESHEILCRGGSLCPPSFPIQSFSEVLRQPPCTHPNRETRKKGIL